jgi:hypothetical protein
MLGLSGKDDAGCAVQSGASCDAHATHSDADAASCGALCDASAPSPFPSPSPLLKTSTTGPCQRADAHAHDHSQIFPVQTESADAAGPSPDTPQPRFTPKELVEIWNQQAAPDFPRVLELTVNREFDARSLLERYPDPGFWTDAIQRMNRSPFWRGEVKGKEDIRGNFDSLLKRETLTKLIEGFYEPREPRRSVSARAAAGAHGAGSDSWDGIVEGAGGIRA